MATDITRITELIKSFKSETREEAVTVQVLGNLLQQIANVIGTTAQQTELAPVSKFYANLTSLNSILTGISAGTDDPNQMHLTLYDCSHLCSTRRPISTWHRLSRRSLIPANSILICR